MDSLLPLPPRPPHGSPEPSLRTPLYAVGRKRCFSLALEGEF